MAYKVDETVMFPNEWLKSFEQSIQGETDEELGAKRVWYFLKSVIAGSQVMSGDMAVDYFIPGYLTQEEKMKKASREKFTRGPSMSKKEKDAFIEEAVRKGMSAADVAEEIYGDRSKDSNVRNLAAWKKAQGVKFDVKT